MKDARAETLTQVLIGESVRLAAGGRALIEKVDIPGESAALRVRITRPDTSLVFSVRGIPAVRCGGGRNTPDGGVVRWASRLVAPDSEGPNRERLRP